MVHLLQNNAKLSSPEDRVAIKGSAGATGSSKTVFT